MTLQFRPPYDIRQADSPIRALAKGLSKGINDLATVPAMWAKYKMERKQRQQESSAMEKLMGLGGGELSDISTDNMANVGKYAAESRKPTQIEQINPDQTTTTLMIPPGVKYGGTVRAPAPNQYARPSDWVDVDGMPLSIDKEGRLIRGDGGTLKGAPIMKKGSQEAVQSTARAAELLPKIDVYFDKLKELGELGARTASTPIVSRTFYPTISQMQSEMAQVGFAFGGKNYTGTEREIIENALIPSWNDSNSSRELKRRALKGYVSGQMNLLDAANLLGPAGNSIKEIIRKDNVNRPSLDNIFMDK